jgi:hypothetical protein
MNILKSIAVVFCITTFAFIGTAAAADEDTTGSIHFESDQFMLF